MRGLICFLLPVFLAAQEPAPGLTLDLRTDLGSDSTADLRLVQRGCWDRLILGATVRPVQPARRRAAEATVEVWDWALPEASQREQSFGLYLDVLQQRLSRAFAVPPPKHQALELSEIMQNDPSTPQKLDLTKVKSMQDRFNRNPPNGSPVR